MLSVLAYLSRDTWARWWEQPISPLARVFVVWVLVSTALVVLLAFFIMAQEIEKRLSAIGGNMILVQETITTDPFNKTEKVPLAHKMPSLDQYGDLYTLQKLFSQATTSENRRVSVYIYDEERMSFLVESRKEKISAPEHHVYFLSDQYPEGTRIRVTLEETQFDSLVLTPPLWSKRFEPAGMLLFPKLVAEPFIERGFVNRTLFMAEESKSDIATLVTSIRAFAQGETGHNSVRIDDPSALLKEAQSLERYQLIWRTALTTVFGGVLCLIFSAIGWLEFRQNRYVGALLISLGTPKNFLRTRDFLENFFLSNIGLVLSWTILSLLVPTILDSLGVNASGSLLLSLDFLRTDGLLLFLMVNAAALAGSFAAWLGICRDEGYILS